jgi:putative hydrolase of the HAD superfamily
MRSDIDAVAFDVDGTFYPNYRLYLRMLPAAFANGAFFAAFARARKQLRHLEPDACFHELQARIVANSLRCDDKKAGLLIQKIFYTGCEGHFRKIAPFPRLRDCLAAFKERGLRLAVLSDFPLGSKLERLGLAGIWDAQLCSEDTGALKPHPLPFRRLAESLEVPPARILYVGNSLAYDIAGAKNAGMKAAHLSYLPAPFWKGGPRADFRFHNYRQLQEYVLH